MLIATFPPARLGMLPSRGRAAVKDAPDAQWIGGSMRLLYVFCLPLTAIALLAQTPAPNSTSSQQSPVTGYTAPLQRTRASMASAAPGRPARSTSTPSHCRMASLHRRQLRPASISRCPIEIPIVCASFCVTMPADASARRRSPSIPPEQADQLVMSERICYLSAISIIPSGTTRHSAPGRACHVDPSA